MHTWNNNNNTMNYGEVEKFYMKNARTGGTEAPEPGNAISATGQKYLDVNIDLRSYERDVNDLDGDSNRSEIINTPFSDSFVNAKRKDRNSCNARAFSTPFNMAALLTLRFGQRLVPLG